MNKVKSYPYFTYKKRLEFSLILVLILMIGLFFSFQRFDSEPSPLPVPVTPEIIVLEIPRTIQFSIRRPSPPLRPTIPVAVDDPEIMDEVNIFPDDLSDLVGGERVFSIDDIEGLPYIPRQILEVLPEQDDIPCQGAVSLALHIGRDGSVKNHRLLDNTTNSEICLQNILKAAYKTRWQPVILESQIYEYWIEKVYRFD